MQIFKRSRHGKDSEDSRQKVIVLTYAQMAEEDFLKTLTKIAGHTGFKTHRDAYNAAKIFRRVTNTLKEMNKGWTNLLKKYAELDARGGFVLDQGKARTFIISDARKKKFEEAKEEFEKTEFGLDCHALDFQMMNDQGAKLSPRDLDAFGLLFKEIPDETN